MEIFKLFLQLIFLLFSVAFVQTDSIQEISDLVDVSDPHKLFDILSDENGDLSNLVNGIIQQKLDQKGVRNQIPTMNVVSKTLPICVDIYAVIFYILFEVFWYSNTT